MQYYEIGYFQMGDIPAFGDRALQELLADHITVIPKDVLDDVRKDCVFLLLHRPRIPGATVPKNLIEGKTVIAFAMCSDDRDELVRMLFHEVAHYHLGHIGRMSDEEYEEQEREADALAKKWESDWEEYLKAKDKSA